METELWPNLIHACAAKNVPVVVANARLSERSAAGYRRLAGLVQPMLSEVSVVAAQSARDAELFVALGALPERVHVAGSIKFDIHLPASLVEQAQVLRRCFGVERGVWIAASTHEGEELQVLDAYARVLYTVPDCLLVLVPRHPERFAAVAAMCRKRGYSTVQRTDAPASCTDVDVFIGNTMGELALFYAACDVAFVGGSLVDVGGHNMLEPAAIGVPVLFGPFLHNFADIAERLLENGAAEQVESTAALAREVVRYLGDANLRQSSGDRARRFVEQNRGALARVMDLVDAQLG
jgi:3-deoxy-D-manno-octulosonic-acid transferase